MFENIGAKIKTLAVGIMIVGVIVYVLVGMTVLVLGADQEEGGMILIGFLIMALGTLIAWISSWFLYGYGELIDKVSKIEKKLPNIGQNYQMQPATATAQSQSRAGAPVPRKVSKPMNLHEIASKMDAKTGEEK